jgi:hypothetical protein
MKGALTCDLLGCLQVGAHYVKDIAKLIVDPLKETAVQALVQGAIFSMECLCD